MKNQEKQTLVEDSSSELSAPAPQDNTTRRMGDGSDSHPRCWGLGAWISRNVDKNLLLSKLFYFFFFASFGAVYPLLAVYFRQLGLSASQSGLIIGFKMLVEFGAAPVWGAISDKSKKAKWVLVLSLVAWLTFTEAIAFVQLQPAMCLTDMAQQGLTTVHNQSVPLPQLLAELGLIRPPFSSVAYRQEEVYHTFIILLVLVIVGQFLGSPTLTLADSATLTFLGRDNYSQYGKQRMFGALGWGLSLLCVGIIVDRAPTPNQSSCQEDSTENFVVCFAAYAVLISVAIVIATQFSFQYHSKDDARLIRQYSEVYSASVVASSGQAAGDMASAGQAASVVAELSRAAASSNDQPPDDRKKPVESDPAGQSEEMQRNLTVEWFGIVKLFLTPRYGSVLFLAGFFGFGLGLVFTFLYWHLEDLGGEPTLFGIAAVMDHTSEFLSFFLSHSLISSLGHLGVICLCLFCNCLRFLYISYLEKAWWILPMEIVQGLVHGLLWSSLTSYIGNAVPQNLRSSAQGILQGVYWGLGIGSGAIIGGLIVNQYGTVFVFRSFSYACMVALAMFLVIIFLTREKSSESTKIKKYGSLQKEGNENEENQKSSHLQQLGSWLTISWGKKEKAAEFNSDDNK